MQQRNSGSPGSNIKILLGKDGSDFAVFLNEKKATTTTKICEQKPSEGGGNEEEDEEWVQSRDWTKLSSISGGGIPDDLFWQLNNLYKTNRHATSVSFGPEGEWFVAGCKQQDFNDSCKVAASANVVGDNAGGGALGIGSTYHFRWGGCSTAAREAIQTAIRRKQDVHDGFKQVCFGYGGQWLLLTGKNQCQYSRNLDDHLKETLERIYCQGKTIYKVQLFPRGGFFIHHSDGHEWKGVCASLDEELVKFGVVDDDNGGGDDAGGDKKPKKVDEVLDVIVASDYSCWIVLRERSFVASKGINVELIRILKEFYDRQNIKNFKESSSHSSDSASTPLSKQQKKRPKHDATTVMSSASTEMVTNSSSSASSSVSASASPSAAITERTPPPEAARRDVERLRRERENDIIKKRNNDDFAKQLVDKNLHVGSRVTVLNASLSQGDAIIEEIVPNKGMKVSMATGIPLLVRDPGQVIAFRHSDPDYSHSEYDNNDPFKRIMMSLCVATDKYEAARAYYPNKPDWRNIKTMRSLQTQAKQSDNTSNDDASIVSIGSDDEQMNGCSFDFFGMWQSQDNKSTVSDEISVQRKHKLSSKLQVRPLLEHRGEFVSFVDNYRCAEKVDMEGLRRVISELARDANRRNQLLERLDSSESLTKRDAEFRDRLTRCHAMEQQARALWRSLQDLPRDDHDCVVHVVEYEHLDASYRGRLFAKGVNTGKANTNGLYPASVATLQTLDRDLHGPLVGKFAHYVDCENSEVRIICSLATQLDLVRLIPTICDYRDNRRKWIPLLASSHRVSEQAAKHLPNFLLNGGKYATWLHANGISREDRLSMISPQERGIIDKFVFKLYVEGRALRDQVLQHPRFRWTSLEREKLLLDSNISEASIDALLFSRVIQSCENEVLSIMHRCFG